MQKTRKILRAISEKTVLPTYQPTNQPTNQPNNQPMLNWRPFWEYVQIKNFFQISSSVTFLPL